MMFHFAVIREHGIYASSVFDTSSRFIYKIPPGLVICILKIYMQPAEKKLEYKYYKEDVT